MQTVSLETNGTLNMSGDDKLNDFLLLYPGINTKPHTKGVYLSGVAKIEHVWYNLQIKCPNFPHLEEVRLQIQQHHLIKSFNEQDIVASQHDDKWTVFELMENLTKIVQSKEGPQYIRSDLNTSTDTTPQNIYAEVAAIYNPDCYKIHLNASCTRIQFTNFTITAPTVEHYLSVILPTLQIQHHSLPECVSPILQKSATLTALLRQFEKYLDELRPFYENLSIIDELCFVVQPESPTPKDNWRLFLLRERVFLKLCIADPFAPTASMSVHIIGPTYEVEKLRRVFSEGMHDWDVELDIHKNLLRIFDLCFFPMPSPTENDPVTATTAATTATGEIITRQRCNICFCYQLDEGQIPIVSCDNRKCSAIFHAACLKQWFNTLADGKQFLNVTFGTCPFCKAKLSTSFAELLEN